MDLRRHGLWLAAAVLLLAQGCAHPERQPVDPAMALALAPAGTLLGLAQRVQALDQHQPADDAEEDDVTNCPVCFEAYEETGDHVPRILPCQPFL